MILFFLVRNIDFGEATCDRFLCITNDCDLVSSDVDSIYIIFWIFVLGKWIVTCSEGTNSKCTSSNVFRSKYGHGYDEEEFIHDYSAGLYIP